MTGGPVGVALVGAGVISDQYLTNLTSYPDVRVVAVADRFPDRAAAQAARYGIAATGVEEALARDDVEIIVNLTNPVAHAEVASAAIAAGKHVFSEKPFALDRTSGRRLLDEATAAGVRIGGAPDTFLGPSLQTCRRVVERGDIGVPLSGLTLLQTPGPVPDHQKLEILLTEGAGPLFDLGPYYLTALVQFFGAVGAVAAMGSTAAPVRVLQSGPRAGQEFAVTVPTHVGALLRFESGEPAQSVWSWDSPLRREGFVEITGTEATLAVPDPNHFTGDIRIRERGSLDWRPVPLEGTEVGGRGLGVLDIARAIREDRPHRADGALAFHVLDTMAAIVESVETATFVPIASSVRRPELLTKDWDPLAVTLS
ncbi:Gfo/Idh/MocA family protein [Pseudonocardia alaniniphila]|uniref:Gfo/Idh/MocA family oxidoreductase n=2 Tax=Pseudonocardia alaniniphila TaxID=75291 RepID=A0ABS9TU50_9PSEU|nr:Gfo/Idh/MocA family oxidoreductase [Pseudonocardia alaniniphila]MCH6172075.1 Gfo/Idh/MocA family oxidoreductase [Pseudonocardia alaniniphila]